MCNLIQNYFGTNIGEMIVDAFTVDDIPLQEPDQGTANAKVRGQGGTGDAHEIVRKRIRIVRNNNPPARPYDPVEIGDGPLYIHPDAARANCLPDRSSPVIDAGDAHRQKPRPIRSSVICSAPEGECLELSLGDHDWKGGIGQERFTGSGHQVQPVGSTWRAEVFLPRLGIAGGIVFEIWLIAAQPVLADPLRVGVEVRDEDAGVVAVFPTDHLGACQGIDPPQLGVVGQAAVNPAGFQGSVVRVGQIGSNDICAVAMTRFIALFRAQKTDRDSAISFFLCWP